MKKYPRLRVLLWGTAGVVGLLLIVTVLTAPLARRSVKINRAETGIASVIETPMMLEGQVDMMPASGYGGREMAMIAPEPVPPSAGVTAGETDQRVIKTGNLSMVVNDVRETASRLASLAAGRGGFVQDLAVQEREDGTHFGNVTIRIPVKEFDSAMEEIRKLANVVQSENVSGQDVTEQYTDLQARLRNAKAQEASYLEIMKRAYSIEDVLAVQRELFAVRATIEGLEGQIQYLENRTDYSTIAVFLTEEPVVRVPTKEFRPLAEIRAAAQSLISLAQALAVTLIWFVIVGGGVLLPLALITWLLVKMVRHFLPRRR